MKEYRENEAKKTCLLGRGLHGQFQMLLFSPLMSTDLIILFLISGWMVISSQFQP
jgi:hypothetical protein